MELLSLAFFVLYILFSAGDCLWAEKRAALKRGTIREEDLRRLKNLYTRRFRVLKFCLMPLLLLFYLSSSLWGWPFGLGSGLLPGPVELTIVLALIFGWAGDSLLELSPKLFPFGLFSFLLGHVFYILRFFLRMGWDRIESPRLVSMILFGAVLAAVIVYLSYMIREVFSIPETKKLRVPLILYLAALAMLVLSSGGLLSIRLDLPSGICFLGACLFVLSDSFLAFAMFKGRNEKGIMVTYTLAQLLLVLGALLAA